MLGFRVLGCRVYFESSGKKGSGFRVTYMYVCIYIHIFTHMDGICKRVGGAARHSNLEPPPPPPRPGKSQVVPFFSLFRVWRFGGLRVGSSSAPLFKQNRVPNRSGPRRFKLDARRFSGFLA